MGLTNIAVSLGLGLLCLSAIPAGAADLLKLPVNAQVEKRDVKIAFRRGAVSSIGNKTNMINGIIGLSSDLGGQQVPLYLLFTEPMDDERAAVLAEHQGRLEGAAQCALAQKGNSPMIPDVKLAVLAQNCTIISVNY